MTASPRTEDGLLAEQTRVLEMIVRGEPLAEVLAALCDVVARESGPAVIGLAGERVDVAWAMPIRSSTGAVLGTFGTQVEPDARAQQLIGVLARTAALAIERELTDRRLRDVASRQRFLGELDAATQALSEPAEVMATSARLLADELRVDRCAYANVEDEQIFDIVGDYTRGVPSIVGRWEVAAFGPACVAHMREGTAYVVEDSEADPRIGPADVLAYRATTIRGVVCVPLHKAGVFTAAMAVHQRVPRRWTSEEIELVSIVVSRCWEALERLRITRDLRASEARYRAIVEATPECVTLISANGEILQINAAGLRMLELDAAVGVRCEDLVAPADREAVRGFVESVCRGEPGQLAFEIIGARGTRRAMESAAVPLPTPDGGFVQLAVSRDVTARVTAQRALAQSRARLDYAVRLSGVGFWYCDLPFDELIWDDRVKAHFFLPPDARVTIELFYERIHPDDRAATRHAIDKSIADHDSYDIIYRTVDPASGAINYIRALGGTAYAADGTPIHFDGVTVDVTAQKRAELQLREQDRRKDEFLATLAHELRNPLAPIRTGLHVLQHGVSEEQSARTRAMMSRQLGHLVHMVDDLLDISRVTLGKITLQRTRVELRDVLDSALETTRSLVEARGHELTLHVPGRPLPIDVDPTRLVQVFANLINNAAKYTPDGGRIALIAEVTGPVLAVRITDNGVGIPADMLPYVFDMFTQVGHSIDRSQGGLGIGLTLVRRLVEMHGGTVTAESAGAGHGSAFTVTLPLAASAPSAAVEPPASASSGLRVLVVDDNVDAAEMLAMLLELRGHTIQLAHTGPAALEVAPAFVPHIIFLDIGLPGLNGYEVARRLRAEMSPVPRLVAVTGWGADEDRRQAAAAGFDRHLVKPVDIEKLEAALGEV